MNSAASASSAVPPHRLAARQPVSAHERLFATPTLGRTLTDCQHSSTKVHMGPVSRVLAAIRRSRLDCDDSRKPHCEACDSAETDPPPAPVANNRQLYDRQRRWDAARIARRDRHHDDSVREVVPSTSPKKRDLDHKRVVTDDGANDSVGNRGGASDSRPNHRE